MEVYVSSWSYRDWFKQGKCDLLSLLDEVQDIGAAGVEVFPRHLKEDDPGAHLLEVAEKARSLDLGISSLIAANDFARPLAGERARHVDHVKDFIVYAAQAGIDRLNTFTGYHTSGDDPMMEVYRVIDAYREVAPVAEEHDVVMCLENHSSVARDADSLLEIIRAVGSDHLRANPDPTNFVPGYQQLGEKAREAIYTETEKYAQLAANAHLKVGDFTEDGEAAYVDVRRYVEILGGAGYDGPIVLEVYGDNDPRETCKKAIVLLRRYL